MSLERVSRRQLAEYAVAQIVEHGRKTEVLREIAAYLIETRRVKEVDLIVREIEDQLARRGEIVADVLSAHAIDDSTREKLTQFIMEADGAQHVHLRETVEPSLIGGVKLQYGGRELDTTIRTKLKKMTSRNA